MFAQRGNALFLILIAVALFAALSYAITQSGRGSGGISKEKTAILAAQIVQQQSTLQQVVQRLMLASQCSLTQISFDQTPASNYNTNAPANHSCDVYDPAGGGLQPHAIPAGAQVALGNPWETYWSESAGFQVAGLGTDNFVAGCPGCELSVAAYSLTDDICKELNYRAVGQRIILTSTPGASFNPYLYDGTFSDEDLFDSSDHALIPGQYSFCIKETGGGLRNVYVAVLVPR